MNFKTCSLLPLLAATAYLGAATLANAAPKTKNAPSAPVSLGNGIFVLGEDAPVKPAQVTPTRLKPRPSPQRAARAPQTNLNAALVRFCRSYLGHKLGNGQCSELAVLGLPAVGARLDFNNQWGTPVCNYGISGGRQYLQLASAGVTRGNPRKANVKAGDIIQYENVKFEQRWDGGYSFKEYPHHTAVVEQVSRDGNTLKVLEQNVNGTQFVVESVLYLPRQTQGVLRITRPMPR